MGIFGSVHKQISDNLFKTDSIALDEYFLFWQRQGKFMLTRVDETAHTFHCLLDYRHQIDLLFFERNDAARDTGYVKKVIDKPDHFLKLAAHDPLELFLRFLSRVPALPYLQGITNRRQRITQLVGQHRQKLVFV